MKKIFLFIFSLSLIFFVACKKININEVKEIKQDDLTLIIANELKKLDNNYSDETLKAMSVVLRNNILINNNKTIEETDEKYLLIAKETNNYVLKNNKDDLIELSFDSYEDYVWKKNIKKSEILEFALKNDISLTSISSVEPVKNNEKIIGLKIGKKFIDYQKLAEEFNLQSNLITNISSNKTEIIINGKDKGFYGYFDIEKAEKLSNNNYNFKEILAKFFDNLELKNIEC